VGGASGPQKAHGIHWHIANRIEYVATDPKRQTIPWVQVTDANGKVSVFAAAGVDPARPPSGERRTMDCMDCHNRPSHPYAANAERAIDDALGSGQMPRTLPFVRRQAVEVVKASYPTQEAALAAIDSGLRTFYQEQYPQVYASRRKEVDAAVAAARHAYSRNVFPQMNVSWGTYVNNLGHNAFPGCFRCHDDSHKSRDGKAIPQDCELCHEMVQ
jgi:formate-dependent nitrite reductase cytochrome c552 subunit